MGQLLLGKGWGNIMMNVVQVNYDTQRLSCNGRNI